MHAIAHYHCDLKEKFGAPRQSGLAPHLRGKILFSEEFRDPEMLRGLEAFTHIWLIWLFSENADHWSPTVRPPRLGGNRRMGVFACRSPFRPNPIGLSCLRLERIERHTPYGPAIYVSGADLIDGTPILDIKPYLPYADCIPEAADGFAQEVRDDRLNVSFVPKAEQWLTEEQRDLLEELISLDPRPRYHDDPDRVYGVHLSNLNVRFKVLGDCALILSAEPLDA